MRNLLEIREKIKWLYSKNEVFIVPVVNFLVAFFAINTINGQLGYMTKVDNIGLVLIASLLCSFLPNGCIVFFSAIFTLLHMYALSTEVAVVVVGIYLVMFLMFFRFDNKDSLIVLFTALLFVLNVPYIMPIAVGLLAGPIAAIPVACGVLIYYLFIHIVANATMISTMGADEATAKLRIAIDGILTNRTMFIVMAAFAITVIVVYIIRRMSIDYAWTIAMITGAIVNVVILLVGDLLYDTNMSVFSAILGSILAIVIAKIIEFFRF